MAENGSSSFLTNLANIQSHGVATASNIAPTLQHQQQFGNQFQQVSHHHNQQSSLLAASSQMSNNKMMPPPAAFMQQQSTNTPIGPIGSAAVAAVASIVGSSNFNNQQPLHSMLNKMSLQHQQPQPPITQCSMVRHRLYSLFSPTDPVLYK